MMTTLLLRFGKTFAGSARRISLSKRQSSDKVGFEADDYTETLDFEKRISSAAPNERSINSVNLLGRVGKDPALVTGMNSVNYARFLFVTRSLKVNKERSTDWHEVVCYEENLKKYILRYIKSGDRLFLQGTINYVRPPSILNIPYNRARIIVRELLVAKRKYSTEEDSDS